MLPENRAFFIRGDDGEDYGPVGLQELREWVQENRAGLGSSVRADEPGSTWQPWQEHPELVALLAEARVTSPVPGLPGLVIAPLGRRVLALLLDLVFNMILVVPIIAVTLLVCVPDWFIQFTVASALEQTPLPSPPLNFKIAVDTISNLMLVLYFTGFLAAHGQTPAKSLLHLRVVDQNGQKPGLLKSFIRGLGLVISLFFPFGLISFGYACFNPQRRAFHDLIAGTYVVNA